MKSPLFTPQVLTNIYMIIYNPLKCLPTFFFFGWTRQELNSKPSAQQTNALTIKPAMLEKTEVKPA